MPFSALVAVGVSFLILIAINIVELATGKLWREPVPPLKLSDAELPHVLVQIPAFNEGKIAAMRSSPPRRSPGQRTSCTSSFSTTAPTRHQNLRKQPHGNYGVQGFDVAHVRRDDRDGFKAGALAHGMTKNDAPIVALLDIDFRAPRDWLLIAVPYLPRRSEGWFPAIALRIFQLPDELVTRVQGLMLDAHYVMEQATRYRAGWLFQFNGTGGLWRREAIEAAGGWMGDSLSEDLDLVVRAELARLARGLSDGPCSAGPRTGSTRPLAGAAAALVERVCAGCA